MSNSTRDLERNIRKNERERAYSKSAENFSIGRLISCYVASAAIIGICLYGYINGEEVTGGTFTYVFLSVLAVVLSIIITVKNKTSLFSPKNKNKHK